MSRYEGPRLKEKLISKKIAGIVLTYVEAPKPYPFF